MRDYTLFGYVWFSFYVFCLIAFVYVSLTRCSFQLGKICRFSMFLLFFSYVYRYAIEWYISTGDFSVSYSDPAESSEMAYNILYNYIYFALHTLALITMIFGLYFGSLPKSTADS